MRFIFIEIIFPLLLFWFARSAFRSVMASFQSPKTPVPQQPQPVVSAGGELKKDPVCGTYVSAAASLTRSVNGETFHFCSPECRERYGKVRS